ncbi:hypothetical protein, partial [Escherichia coli]|uniref:hypothetical protein n=1 Tax=Escherichia coli TaxID=562 RepID=UPI001BDD4DC2
MFSSSGVVFPAPPGGQKQHRNGACYGAGLWLDFPFTVLLTVPDFMGGVLLTVLRCWIQHCEA